MSLEQETQVVPAPSSRPRKYPVAWLVISGVLLLLWIITFIVGKTTISSTESRYQSLLKEQIDRKGEVVASVFSLAHPSLLSEEGQRIAQKYFTEIMKDEDILYLTLLNNNGEVCATSDLRFTRDKAETLPDFAGKTISRPAPDGVNVEYYGPIHDTNGMQVGAVRVGVSYASVVGTKTKKKK